MFTLSINRNWAVALSLVLLTPSTFGQVAALENTPAPPAAALTPPTVLTADRLTLVQALDIGLHHSPQIAVSEHQTAGARANLSGQRAPLNPTISYAGINNTVAPVDLGNPANYNLYVTVETSGRQRLRTDQARAQLQGTEFDARTTHLSVRQSISTAYIALQVADRGLENEQDAYATAQRLSDLTEKQFRLGAAPETNAIRARIALTQEEQNMLQAVNSVRTARANLNIALGRDPDQPIDASEPLVYKPTPIQLEALQQQALKLRPEILSAAASRRALQAAVGLQRSQYYPDLILGSDLKFDALQVGLTLPLFDLGSIRGAVGQAKEAVKAQEAQETQERQSVLLDVQTAYLAMTVAQRTVDSFQDGILPRAGSLLQKVEQGYRLGASTILDLIDAQETVRNARNDYNTALGNYRQAEAQLERAVGAPIEEIEVTKP